MSITECERRRLGKQDSRRPNFPYQFRRTPIRVHQRSFAAILNSNSPPSPHPTEPPPSPSPSQYPDPAVDAGSPGFRAAARSCSDNPRDPNSAPQSTAADRRFLPLSFGFAKRDKRPDHALNRVRRADFRVAQVPARVSSQRHGQLRQPNPAVSLPSRSTCGTSVGIRLARSWAARSIRCPSSGNPARNPCATRTTVPWEQPRPASFGNVERAGRHQLILIDTWNLRFGRGRAVRDPRVHATSSARIAKRYSCGFARFCVLFLIGLRVGAMLVPGQIINPRGPARGGTSFFPSGLI